MKNRTASAIGHWRENACKELQRGALFVVKKMGRIEGVLATEPWQPRLGNGRPGNRVLATASWQLYPGNGCPNLWPFWPEVLGAEPAQHG
jgi:hypothetical protein